MDMFALIMLSIMISWLPVGLMSALVMVYQGWSKGEDFTTDHLFVFFQLIMLGWVSVGIGVNIMISKWFEKRGGVIIPGSKSAKMMKRLSSKEPWNY